MYVIPRRNDCVFGGTNDLSADLAGLRRDRADHRGMQRASWRSRRPQVIAERVGLRPFRRSGICLRADRLIDGRAVIRNYGHGGSGFTLSWGCAQEVTEPWLLVPNEMCPVDER